MSDRGADVQPFLVVSHYVPEGRCSFQYSSRCRRRDLTRTEIPRIRAIAATPRKIQVQSSDPRKIAFDHVAIRPISIKRSAALVSLLFIRESTHDDATGNRRRLPAKGPVKPVPYAGPLSGQPAADLRLCEIGIQRLPYTLPAKLPGEGALYATHEFVPRTVTYSTSPARKPHAKGGDTRAP